jgi:hypothetical protein
MNLGPRKRDEFDDLDWLAFCYINNELTSEELEAFEDRLSREQTTRDAVERAVQSQFLLAAALSGAQSSTQRESTRLVSHALSAENQGLVAPFARSRNSGRVRFRAGRLFAAVAAVLLMALGLWTQRELLLPTQQPAELANHPLDGEVDTLGEEWYGNDDYVNQLATALTEGDPDSEEDYPDGLEYMPVTLRDDWMVDVFSELGDSIDEEETSEANQSEKSNSWG